MFLDQKQGLPPFHICQFSFTFSTRSQGSPCSPLAASSSVPSPPQLLWAEFLSASPGPEPAQGRTPQRGEGTAGTHCTWTELPWDPPEAPGLVPLPGWLRGSFPSPLSAPAPCSAAFRPVASPRALPAESPGCHSVRGSSVGDSVLGVTLPSRAGGGRDRAAPGAGGAGGSPASDPAAAPGTSVTLGATGSDARALHLHGLQQGAQGFGMIFRNGKESPHLTAVTPHSQR